ISPLAFEAKAASKKIIYPHKTVTSHPAAVLFYGQMLRKSARIWCVGQQRPGRVLRFAHRRISFVFWPIDVSSAQQMKGLKNLSGYEALPMIPSFILR
ncbi:hypothetical protein LHT11_14910, partial [Acetobacter indonesiensis]